MDGTILGQGSFSANFLNLSNPNAGNAAVGSSNPTIIQIPSGADWVKVYNYTQAGTNGNSSAYLGATGSALVGYEFYWQLGMPVGAGMVKYKANGAATVDQDVMVAGAFTLYDPAGQNSYAQPALGPAVAISAITDAVQPVVSTGSTAGITVGSVVRLSNTTNPSICGIDMVVSAVTAGSAFTLLFSGNELTTIPGHTGGATGFWRLVNTSPLYYPGRRFITAITQAAQAQVSTSTEHNLTVGQEVRFNIPAVSGMVQLNGSSQNNYAPAIVTSLVDAYNFTVNVNTTGYSAFTSPTDAQQPSSYPTVIPFGEDTATALAANSGLVPQNGGLQIYNTNTGILADSTVNTGYMGMILGSGGFGTALSTTNILGPSGSIAWSAGNAGTPDLMYWVAGKSTYGGQ